MRENTKKYLEGYRHHAEKYYSTTSTSVLRYITELEAELDSELQTNKNALYSVTFWKIIAFIQTASIIATMVYMAL